MKYDMADNALFKIFGPAIQRRMNDIAEKLLGSFRSPESGAIQDTAQLSFDLQPTLHLAGILRNRSRFCTHIPS
jgi:hypothetical protein